MPQPYRMPGDLSPFLGLLQRRERLLPTWRGWLVLTALAGLLATFVARRVQPFLTVTDPAPGGALVVEGWIPDYGMEAALAEARRTPYQALFVTGGPVERGEPLSFHKTYASLGAAVLARLGADSPAPQAVPSRVAYRDRTFTSAVALRDWLRERGAMPSKLTLVTLGAHARRSRLLFERAFGPGVEIGVIAVPDRSYDGRHWWRSSQGFRTVTGELIAYLYVRCVF